LNSTDDEPVNAKVVLCAVLLGWNSYLPPKDALRNGKIAAMAAL